MRKQQNIFRNLVKNEDSTTELLTNLLYIKTFREAFLESLEVDNSIIRKIQHDQFSTQKTVKNSKPDITLSSDEIFILFEVKTIEYRELTDSQKNAYSEVFESDRDNDRDKILVFIIPQNYNHKSFIKNTITKKALKFGVPTKIITWEKIIDIIEGNELNIISNYLDDFLRILKGWYSPKIINFTAKEIMMLSTQDIPKLLNKLREIVDVVDSLNNDYNSSTYSDKKWTEYGIYYKDKQGNNILYFGIWMDFWIKKKTPFCIGVDRENFSKKSIMAFNEYAGNSVVKVYGYNTIPVKLEDLENESIAQEIWIKITDILKKQINT